MPRYKRVTDFLHSRGVDLIFVDSDGDISLLIPLWLECGINGMWPFEVEAGMDVVKLRKEYGRDILMIGGLDKRELAESKNKEVSSTTKISNRLTFCFFFLNFKYIEAD